MEKVKVQSVVYTNTIQRMKEKGFKKLSEVETNSFIVDRIEFWINSHSIPHIVEVYKSGGLTVYKECKI